MRVSSDTAAPEMKDEDAQQVAPSNATSASWLAASDSFGGVFLFFMVVYGQSIARMRSAFAVITFMIRLFQMLSLSFVCCACTPFEAQTSDTNTHIIHDGQKQDEISFWMDWPPQTYPLSKEQAAILREIVNESESRRLFSGAPEGAMVSPARDLSSFTIDGKEYLFIPPSEPCDFRLSNHKKQMLHDFMSTEFGITSRWQRPVKRKGEQAAPSNR
jgi:hypothetical protein